MTPIEFAAWVRGVNAALNGAMPSKELWAEVVKEAQGIAPAPAPTYPFAPVAPVAPQGPAKRSIFDRLPSEPLPYDKRYSPAPREFILGGAMAAQGQEQR